MVRRMVSPQNSPAWGSLRSVLNATLFVCAALAAVAPRHSFALPQRRVIPGQEIVVSFKPPAFGQVVRSTRVVGNVQLPSGLRMKRVHGIGSIGVVSSDSAAFAANADPVPVDDAEIARRCDEILKKNQGLPIVCEANTLFDAVATTPNDPYYSALYGLAKIQAPAAWDISTGSSGVMVAVIDTGVQYTHPDLSPNIAVNTGETPNNGVDDDRNGYVDDYYGYDFINYDGNPMDDHYHGTHCAGTIGAKGDNSVGVVGVSWRASILPVKVLSASGSGSLASVAAGINYAVARGAKILSMSLGGSSSSATLDNAISAARTSGVLIVAAAGNSGQNMDYYPSYPASSPSDNVLAIAATDSSDTPASWSNYGPLSVDVAAPGVSIYSTLLGSGYDYLSGTSMATPHVAGMAAVLKAINPGLSYLEIKTIIMQTVDPIAALNGKIVSGGRVNLYKAALAARDGSSTPTPAPTATPTPIQTATPTPSTPTPTPTPEPTEPPADSPYREMSISLERMKRMVYIFGEVRDENEGLVVGIKVNLRCRSRLVTSRTTDEEGYYEVPMRRPNQKITCYVEDEDGNRSRRLRFR